MDLTTTTTTTKTSDPTENETPPHPLSIKSKSFTNGSSLHHHPPPPTVTFKECLKNHAASLGAHALDGCGEFMQSPTATPTDPTSLTCAACGCHRNFHRRESDNPTAATHFLDFRRCRSSPSPSPSPPPLPYAPHMLLALRTAAAPEDHHHHQQQAVATPATPTALKAENSSGRKRFRTKFSQEQKDKMLSFAEKLGWKMQKCDEDLVENFCNEIGIGKGVLKVWLHNNKSTLGKRSDTINNNSNGRVNSFDDNNVNCDDHKPQNEISGSGVTVDHRHLHVSTNGSSSSS